MKKGDQPIGPPERPPGDFETAPLTGGAMQAPLTGGAMQAPLTGGAMQAPLTGGAMQARGARAARLCKICGQPIHLRRLAASPRAVTDTARCSAENLRRLRNDANRRWQQKQRDQRRAESGSVVARQAITLAP